MAACSVVCAWGRSYIDLPSDLGISSPLPHHKPLGLTSEPLSTSQNLGVLRLLRHSSALNREHLYDASLMYGFRGGQLLHLLDLLRSLVKQFPRQL